ncbi:MAG: hypothetical protein ACRBC3_01075 [Burkholderiaceae bacterium]
MAGPFEIPLALKATSGNAFRYLDEHTKLRMAKVMPGYLYVTSDEEQICTTLGSCIAVCVRDPDAKVGGMNHFLLPEKTEAPGGTVGKKPADQNRYGSYAMENLIRAVIGCGGRRGNLEFKVFGGAKVLKAVGSVGERNIEFVENFLLQAGLTATASDVGGTQARKVQYDPITGRAKVRRLNENAQEEKEVIKKESQLMSIFTSEIFKQEKIGNG